MSDEITDDPELTPEQERDVRRMLADARHAEPMPGDVAARLDRVLAELAAGEHPTPTPVADLASHRRRRVATLLVAAAAVVAVGIGIGQVLPLGSDDASTSSDSTLGGEAAGTSPDPAQRKSEGAGAGSSESQLAPEPASGSTPAYALPRPRRVSEGDFASDVRRVRGLALGAAAAYNLQGNGRGTGSDSPELDAVRAFDCTPADWGAGVFVPVVYAGDPGVLVLRRPTGDTQVVDLFQCGSDVVLRSITLPAP